MENALINLESMKDNVGLAEKSSEKYPVKLPVWTGNTYGSAGFRKNALTQAKQNYSNALLDYKQAEIKLIKKLRVN